MCVCARDSSHLLSVLPGGRVDGHGCPRAIADCDHQKDEDEEDDDGDGDNDPDPPVVTVVAAAAVGARRVRPIASVGGDGGTPVCPVERDPHSVDEPARRERAAAIGCATAVGRRVSTRHRCRRHRRAVVCVRPTYTGPGSTSRRQYSTGHRRTRSIDCTVCVGTFCSPRHRHVTRVGTDSPATDSRSL